MPGQLSVEHTPRSQRLSFRRRRDGGAVLSEPCRGFTVERTGYVVCELVGGGEPVRIHLRAGYIAPICVRRFLGFKAGTTARGISPLWL